MSIVANCVFLVITAVDVFQSTLLPYGLADLNLLLCALGVSVSNLKKEERKMNNLAV